MGCTRSNQRRQSRSRYSDQTDDVLCCIATTEPFFCGEGAQCFLGEVPVNNASSWQSGSRVLFLGHTQRASRFAYTRHESTAGNHERGWADARALPDFGGEKKPDNANKRSRRILRVPPEVSPP